MNTTMELQVFSTGDRSRALGVCRELRLKARADQGKGIPATYTLKVELPAQSIAAQIKAKGSMRELLRREDVFYSEV